MINCLIRVFNTSLTMVLQYFPFASILYMTGKHVKCLPGYRLIVTHQFHHREINCWGPVKSSVPMHVWIPRTCGEFQRGCEFMMVNIVKKGFEFAFL